MAVSVDCEKANTTNGLCGGQVNIASVALSRGNDSIPVLKLSVFYFVPQSDRRKCLLLLEKLHSGWTVDVDATNQARESPPASTAGKPTTSPGQNSSKKSPQSQEVCTHISESRFEHRGIQLIFDIWNI